MDKIKLELTEVNIYDILGAFSIYETWLLKYCHDYYAETVIQNIDEVRNYLRDVLKRFDYQNSVDK